MDEWMDELRIVRWVMPRESFDEAVYVCCAYSATLAFQSMLVAGKKEPCLPNLQLF